MDNLKLFIFTAVIIFSTNGFSQWINLSYPDGSDVRCFAQTSSGIYAGKSYAVLRSTDNGNSWVSSNTGLTPTSIVFGLAESNGIIIAATTAGLYRSTNSGASWELSASGLPSPSLSIRNVINQNNILFISTSNQGLYQSTDNGQSWVITSLTETFIYTLNSFNDTLYAGSRFGRFYRSGDNGQTWSKDSIGTAQTHVRDFAFTDSTMFIGLQEAVYRSRDRGHNDFTRVFDSGIGGTSFELEALEMHNNNIYAGIYAGFKGVHRSTDDGLTWHNVSEDMLRFFSPDTVFQGIISLYSTGISLFAGTFGFGIRRTVNDGEDWELICLPNPSFKNIYTDQDKILAAGGFFYSYSNNFPNWNLHTAGLFGSANSIIRVGSYLFISEDGSIVKRSSDDGKTWYPANSGLTSGTVQSFTSNGNILFGSAEGYGVFVSSDFGESWNAINTGLTNLNIKKLAYANGVLIAFANNEVFRSTDNGLNWNQVSNGLPASFNIWSSAVKGNDFYVGTSSAGGITGIYWSEDGGLIWSDINPNNYNIQNTLISHGDTLFGGGLDIYFTTNNGQTWTEVTGSIGSVNSLAVANGYLYASLSLGGLSRIPLSGIAEINETENTSFTFQLYNNYPNPFNPITVISYQLPVNGEVTLKVFDILGNEVATLVDEYKPAGTYEVEFNAASGISDLVSGIYFYQLHAGSFVQTKKMVLMK